MKRLIALPLLAASLTLAACGSDDKPKPTTTTVADGKTVFVENCGSCHTLNKAGTRGQAGPNLTETSLDKSAIAAQVAIGGGGMPAFSGSLSEEEINAVAEYVAGTAIEAGN